MPGIRAIKDTWDLKEGETFSVLDYMPGQVLADDGVSLRDKSPEEKLLEVTAKTAQEIEDTELNEILTDAKTGALFEGLKRAKPAQINTFIEAQFSTFTSQQKRVLELLLRAALLTFRKLK